MLESANEIAGDNLQLRVENAKLRCITANTAFIWHQLLTGRRTTPSSGPRRPVCIDKPPVVGRDRLSRCSGPATPKRLSHVLTQSGLRAAAAHPSLRASANAFNDMQAAARFENNAATVCGSTSSSSAHLAMHRV